MAVLSPDHLTLRWDGQRLEVIDQTLLPTHEQWLELTGAEDTAAAIRRLAVRGAPMIGITAAYGLALELARDPAPETLERAAHTLRTARPTAVNLAWAVDRVHAAARAAGEGRDPGSMAQAARVEAERIHAEEDAASAAIAAAGAEVLAGARRIVTYCNTGALAAGGHGTALAVVLALHERSPVEVLACETRPLLQGARLTVWELARFGIPHALAVDGAIAGLIRRGEADAAIVGCDRVAANGDTANKVGTYALALACQAASIPFVVAGPVSSIDPTLPDGDSIEIEERGAEEVRAFGGALVTLPDTPVRNPAFDVTPAELITALVTERGVARPPTRETIAELLT
jgi:methylthioribose-1-phosphate isomerase